MEQGRIPKPGEIYKHFKDKQYQIITVATHSESRELMVVYQALYGDFKTFVRPLEMFISEVDHIKYPDIKQKYRFERKSSFEDLLCGNENQVTADSIRLVENVGEAGNREAGNREAGNREAENREAENREAETCETEHSEVEKFTEDQGEALEMTGEVNSILMEFLDGTSYNKKLEVLLLNKKHLNDRLINDMAVSLDVAVDEGPLETRIQGLVNCLSALSRFEHRRLR
jgi:hypothetical protein